MTVGIKSRDSRNWKVCLAHCSKKLTKKCLFRLCYSCVTTVNTCLACTVHIPAPKGAALHSGYRSHACHVTCLLRHCLFRDKGPFATSSVVRLSRFARKWKTSRCWRFLLSWFAWLLLLVSIFLLNSVLLHLGYLRHQYSIGRESIHVWRGEGLDKLMYGKHAY